MASEKTYFAGGCFWGVEYYFQHFPGVLSTSVGYIGGTTEHPTYEQVCTKKTGHAETLEVVFDPAMVSFEELTKLFFEIHDPTQKDRQGPDIGNQYRSAIFYTNTAQKVVAEKLIEVLKEKEYNVVTELAPEATFWKGEEYHQRYYAKNGKQPYCHVRTRRF